MEVSDEEMAAREIEKNKYKYKREFTYFKGVDRAVFGG